MFFRGLLAATAAMMVAAGAARATSFDFQFTDVSPGASTIVGSGTFSTSANLTTPGLYALDSLPDYSMSYQFVDGSAFTTSDIMTPTDGVALRVLTSGSTLALQWTEAPGSLDADGGPFSGALDLVGGGSISPASPFLSFQPTWAGGNTDFLEGTTLDGGSTNFGVYQATLAAGVPEPATWAVMILGLGAVGVALRRRASLAVA